MLKSAQFKTKGMQRDMSLSAFNSEYAYENKNMRLQTEDNTLFSLVNEKGTLDTKVGIEGIPIGQAVISNNLIVFTVDKNRKNPEYNQEYHDRIYKIYLENGDYKRQVLFSGDLNLNYKYPIETIGIYENKDLIKIYWTDNYNSPRFINIVTDKDYGEENPKYNNSNIFEFSPTLKLKEKVTIDKSTLGSGEFAPGVLQYVFTYYNKYGQETNIFYASPLLYTSYETRGGSPEDKVNNSFTITIENADSNFDYIRIYSILRTSINATPEVKRVADVLVISSSDKIVYIDKGLTGDAVDPTELLYVGGEDIKAGTMAQKDNTLFLGNIENKKLSLNSILKEELRKGVISFTTLNKSVTPAEASGYYPYKNQLNLDSYKIKFFKYLEWYRFGIQAQYKNGKWSDPIWIKDAQCNVHIDTGDLNSSNEIEMPIAHYKVTQDVIKKLVDNGYIKIRPVIVYPSLNDRECICQGILCPTVYNVEDRFGNSPFVQSSWYVRPNMPFDIKRINDLDKKKDASIVTPLDSPSDETPSIYSRYGITNNETSVINGTTLDTVNKGSWVEFRHNYPVPSSHLRNGEIQCVIGPPEDPTIEKVSGKVDDNKTTEYISHNAENYYIDQSIVTLHSPDIEFDDTLQHLDTSKLKLRITGIVPLTSFVANVEITTTTPTIPFKDSSEFPRGFYKEPIGVSTDISSIRGTFDWGVGDSHFGGRALVSAPLWFDEMNSYKKDVHNSNHLSTGFVVYPWHRNGSLNNTKYNDSNGYKAALLDKKRMSNLRVSYKTLFLNQNSIWKAEQKEDSKHNGISGVSIFNSNEISLTRIPAPKNSKLPDLNYYGNVDKLLTVSRWDNGKGEDFTNKKNGYYIIVSGIQNDSNNAHTLFSGNYASINGKYTNDVYGVDPVRIKYKSTPHAVLALNYTSNNEALVLPTLLESDDATTIGDKKFIATNSVNKESDSTKYNFWNPNIGTGVYQDALNAGVNSAPVSGSLYGIKYGWLWLGELYNDKDSNRFGGDSEDALENNQWVPCGEAVRLINDNETLKSEIDLQWTEGDTYYQRYDHIKTYPFTTEDQNQMTEIISFMCETRINLDGRYDRNRGQTNNLSATPTNFNKMNPVYDQGNNFFNYRSENPDKLNLNTFPNTITWTKTKTLGELTDTWTNITLASTLDLDGDKGNITKLSRYNNELIAFQDKGISQILYNENTQISTTEGVPIEIANSGKVNGKRYITDKVGCMNKWSICETPSGIYFIDDITKGVYVFNGQINNLSDKMGFHSWIRQNSKMNIWNPIDFEGFVTYYDAQNSDILFINSDTCLAYSELIGQFTSFYSYEHTPYFNSLEDKGYWIKDEKLWQHNGGNYNEFFGKYEPFYTTVIANPEMNADKIFNTIEFRSDGWSIDTNKLTEDTFDKLEVWNEYQKGEESLVNAKYRPSNLKKKFRIWRANIPRDKANGRDRIRNPWAYIKLSKETENTNKYILHDIIVNYFI